MSQASSPARARAWLFAAIACGAMLLLPALAWLLAPRPIVALHIAPSPTMTGHAPEPPLTALPILQPPPAADTAEPDEAPITGRVVDPDGHPVAHAFVSCDDHDTARRAPTDDDGRFELPASAAGCMAFAAHTSFLTTERVPLVAGRKNVIAFDRGGAIEGEVVDERGTPLTTYQLAVEAYLGANADASPLGRVKAIDDARGVFLWDGLAPGAYVLTAAAPGRPPVRSRSIDVERGRTVRHVRIVAARGATLHGRVIDADTRRPVAGASVGFDALTSTALGSGGWVRTDDAGAYALEGAPQGPFSIRVARDGYTSKIVSHLVTRGADALQQDVEIRPLGDGGAREELAGVGAILAPTGRGVQLGTVFPGGPADVAGLKPGDRIRRIDGEDASVWTMSDCIQRLRGVEGSIVRVQVERDGRPLDVSVTRRAIAR